MRRTGLERIDTAKLSWTHESQQISNAERLHLYESIKSVVKDVNACGSYNNYNDHDEGEKSPIFNIKSRIGSNSTQGEVYLVRIDYIDNAALKVMPYIDDKSKEMNDNEIRIASFLSDLVVRGEASNFPLVYHSLHCNHVIYSLNSIFYHEANRQGMRKAICNHLKGNISDRAIKLINAKLKQLSSHGKYTLEEYIRDIIQQQDDIFPSESKTEVITLLENNMLIPTMECDILISELAEIDLTQYIKKHLEKRSVIPNSVIYQLLEQIFAGIIAMQKYNIIHNDLHQGNILYRDGSWLIHDFGKSEMKESLDTNDSTEDILNFISSILTYQYGIQIGDRYALATDAMTKKFREFIVYLHKFISSNSQDPEIMEKAMNKLKNVML